MYLLRKHCGIGRNKEKQYVIFFGKVSYFKPRPEIYAKIQGDLIVSELFYTLTWISLLRENNVRAIKS